MYPWFLKINIDLFWFITYSLIMSNALVSVFFGEERFLVEEAGQEYISTYSDFQWSVLEGDLRFRHFITDTIDGTIFINGYSFKKSVVFYKSSHNKEAKQLVTFFQQHAHPDVRILITHKGS